MNLLSITALALSCLALTASMAATAAITPDATKPAITPTTTLASRPVRFQVNNETLIGKLYLPASITNQTPAAIVTGAWFTVKEQMADRYAKELASRGVIAMTFDFRGWGESQGTRRQLESPASKIADIIAAAKFLRTQPEVGGRKVDGLGICASAGYMVTAATQSDDLESIALVAPWLHDKTIVEQVYGGAEGVAKLIDAGRKAEADFKASGKQAFLPAASTTDKNALMFNVPYYTETDRGMIAAWRNEIDPSFWEGWLTFDAHKPAADLKQPLLIVHSEAAAIPQGAKQFAKNTKAITTQVWLENVNQLDFYDRPAPVNAAADAVARHFMPLPASSPNTTTTK
jgi:uncharacterized protein